MAADKREATPRQGARQPLTTPMELEPPLGARQDVTQSRGGPQLEERHSMATEVKRINRRRIQTVRSSVPRVSAKQFRTRHLLRNGALIHAFDQPLPQLVSNFRQVAKGNVLRSIITIHLLYRRTSYNVNHMEIVRKDSAR
jgi:hypothetical protein